MYGHNDVNINNIDEQFHYKNLEKKKQDPVNKEPSVFDDPVLKSRLDATNKRVEENFNPFALQNANQAANKQKQVDERAARTKTLSDALKRVNKNKNALTHTANVHVPENTALFSEYGTTYKNSMWAWRRAYKINNKKSRLYAKHQNYKAILIESDKMTRRKHELMTEAMKGRMVGVESQETFHDLSAFMVSMSMSKIGAELGGEIKDKNKELLDDFLGVYNEQTGEIENQNKTSFYDKITSYMFAIDVSDVNFENDTEMVKHAGKLENLVNCVGAYDRLMKDSGAYFEGMEPKLKKAINERIDYLRSVAAYYQSRKELLSDETYRTHYDHELTMEVTEKTPEDQRALAEKLMRSYVLGKNMIRKNSGSNEPINVLEVHLVNDASKQLFQQAMEMTDKESQKQYLEKAYTSMDYLASGIQLSSDTNVLGAGYQQRLDYFRSARQEGDQIERSDLEKIKDMLSERGLNTGINSNVILVNPMTGLKNTGLGLNRFLLDLTKNVTARMGTKDIVDMVYGLFAPGLEQNKNLSPDSNEGKKVNEAFNKALKTFRGIQLTALRGYMNTFGNLPMQFACEDNKKLLLNHGVALKEYSALMQDNDQFFDADRMNQHIKISNSQNDTTREILYRNTFVKYSNMCLDIQDDMQIDDEHGAEDNIHFNVSYAMREGTTPAILFENLEKNKYITGPSMNKKQLDKYQSALEKTYQNRPEELASYKERRKVLTDTTSAVLELWEDGKLSEFGSKIDERLNAENMTAEDVKAIERDVDLRIRTLDPLKKLKSWQNPDLETNAEVRKKIILARENEHYLIGMKNAIDLAYKYKKIKQEKQKEGPQNVAIEAMQEVLNARTAYENCKSRLKICSSEYEALARYNVMVDKELPKEKDFTQANFDAQLKDFVKLNYKQLKFSDIKDVIKNYHHNLNLCLRAERFQNMLGEALLNGDKFQDDFLMETRAKLAMFNDIKKSIIYVNSIAIHNPDLLDDTEAFENRLLEEARDARSYLRVVYPGEDLEAVYEEYTTRVKQEHDNRETTIRYAYYGISNIARKPVDEQGKEVEEEQADHYIYPEISAQELERRKNEYQTNQMIHEYLFRISTSFTLDTVRNQNAISTYCKRNGFNEPSFNRPNVFAYLKPSKAIDIYKKSIGTKEEQMEYCKFVLDEVNKCKVEDFQMKVLGRLFKGSSLKQRIKATMLGANITDIGDKMSQLVKDGLPVPEGYGFKDADDIKKKMEVLQKFYITCGGRIISLCNAGAGKYRGAASIKDYKNLKEEIALAKDDEEHFIRDKGFEDNRENIAKVSGIYPLHPLAADNEVRYLGLDEDVKMIYREEYNKKMGHYPD